MEFLKCSHVRLCERNAALSTARGPGALDPDMCLRALPTLSLVFHVIYMRIQISGTYTTQVWCICASYQRSTTAKYKYYLST